MSLGTMQERNQLFEQHKSLAEIEAKRRFRTVARAVVFGDLLSASYEGLLDAATRFDVTKVHESAKQPFECFARPRIRGSMNDFLRTCNWGTRNNPILPTSLELSSCDYFDDGSSPLKDALIAHGKGSVDYLNSPELFEKIIRGLPHTVKQIFYLRYVAEMTMREIADHLFLSESRISQILSQHIEYLSAVLEDHRCELWSEAMEVK